MTVVRRSMRQFLSLFLSCALVMSAAPPAEVRDEPIVPRDQLRERLKANSSARAGHLEQVERLFNQAAIHDALRSAKLDSAAVASAASLLSDAELAKLAARSADIERDIAAGAFNNQMLTYIVIALATAVLVLILVH